MLASWELHFLLAELRESQLLHSGRNGSKTHSRSPSQIQATLMEDALFDTLEAAI